MCLSGLGEVKHQEAQHSQALEETTIWSLTLQKASIIEQKLLNSLTWQDVILLKIKDLMLQGKQAT